MIVSAINLPESLGSFSNTPNNHNTHCAYTTFIIEAEKRTTFNRINSPTAGSIVPVGGRQKDEKRETIDVFLKEKSLSLYFIPLVSQRAMGDHHET